MVNADGAIVVSSKSEIPMEGFTYEEVDAKTSAAENISKEGSYAGVYKTTNSTTKDGYTTLSEKYSVVAPAISGVAAGIPYKVISNLSSQSHGLMSNDKDITSLVDITSEDKIALVNTGSIQHILLSMASGSKSQC